MLRDFTVAAVVGQVLFACSASPNPPSPNPPIHVGEGHFYVSWSEDPATGPHHDVGGFFQHDPQPVYASSCLTTEFDDCTLVSCPPIPPPCACEPTDPTAVGGEPNDAPMFDASTPSNAGPIESAGTLTVSGLLPQGQGSVVIGPYPPYPSVYDDRGARKLWDGGEAIQIDFSGDQVPASHQSIVAPSPVVLAAPVLVDGLSIDRTKPLLVAWTGTSAGTVRVQIQNWPEQTLTCTRSAALGQASIAAETLSRVKAGTGNITISFRNEGVSDTGGWTLTTELETFPAGAHFATIQLP